MGMQDENALVLFIPVYLGSVRLCFVMDGSCSSCLGVSENNKQVQISYCFVSMTVALLSSPHSVFFSFFFVLNMFGFTHMKASSSASCSNSG